MSRPATFSVSILATLLALAGAATTVADAGADAGRITGEVTTAAGAPLAGIDVAATPVGGDSVVQTTSDGSGRYTLGLDPGTYDVGFNAPVFGPIDIDYQTTIYGGPGPGPANTCVICHGAPVTVTAGSVTSGIDASLSPAPFTLTGFVRPLSGKTIRAVGGRLTFNVGCHEYPHGCTGTGDLRVGGAAIAATSFSFPVNSVGALHFTIPLSVRRRLRKAKARGLAAVVDVVTQQSRTTTHFKLVERT